MIGTTISHYRIVEKIGQGGMGEVFRAEDTSLNRTVALKFLPEHLQEDLLARKRFLREAESAAALEHPYICNIKEVSQTDDGQDFIVMEYVEGQTLKERLQEGPLPLREALRISAEVVDALEMAHGKGIVHRDLKPANIMLTPQGHAKVMDFGLAKRVLTDEGTEQDLTSGITKDGATPGTPAYMSPEQIRTEPVDSRSDLFSLGIVLYEMLTGVHPFLRPSAAATMGAILHEDPEPLAKHLPGSPELLRETVGRLLTKDPRTRFQTIEQLSSRLTELSSGQWEPRLAAFLRSRLGRSLILGLAAVVATIYVGQRFLREAGGPVFSSIAVLPLANLSGDPEQEYFVDGMTEALTTSLGRISSLTVTTQSAAKRFKNSELSAAEIAAELGVDALVAGSVLREGDRVRITARLVDPSTESNLWTQAFERSLTSVMALYSDVTQAIASEIEVTLTPEEETRLATTQEVDPEAYDAYLKGTVYWRNLTREVLDTAERYFELALEKDPLFALGYSGLARVWGGRSQMHLAPTDEAGAKGLAAAQRAIELDEDAAEAHEAMAMILSWHAWDWAGAWPHWRRSLDINPNFAEAHAFFAHFLAIMGRPEEALPHAARAVELDPFNSLFHAMQAVTFLFNRRFDEFKVADSLARAIDPNQPIGFRNAALSAQRRYEERLANQRERNAADSELIAALDRGFAEGGYEGAQLAMANILEQRYEMDPGGGVRVDAIAAGYMEGGDLDRAMDWLEEGLEEHDPNLPYVGFPNMSPLRSHPRFPDLLRGMNFPEEVIARYLEEAR
jgi:serine/threonine protein kinase/tetratricopeptide (TPR) repeat protein